MKVAIIYDWIHTFGGAERILLCLHKLFPKAPFYTSVYSEKHAVWAKKLKIYHSFLQKFPQAVDHHELYPLLTPIAFESFDLSAFDVVISVTSADAKGVITGPNTLHISYILTPTRYIWSHVDYYLGLKLIKFISTPMVSYLKKWDMVAKSRPDYLFSISKTVKERIEKYYNRQSKVVYPPLVFEAGNKSADASLDYYLCVSRLVPYKRLDLVINVFNRLQKKLVIVGVGRQRNYLTKIARPSISFVGNLTDKELISYYKGSRAVIVSSEEDFGLVGVEAQSFGIPVIALAKGGSLETVKENITGLFFNN